MQVRIDTRQVPPLVELLDEDDFTSFKAVVVVGSHTWVAPSALEALATHDDLAVGAGGDWRRELDGMVAFAKSKGWTDERDQVRAHVEVVSDSAEV